MNPRTLVIVLALAAVPFAAGAVLPERERPAAAPADGLLVKYRPGVSPQAVQLHADSLGIEMLPDAGAQRGALGKLRAAPREHARVLRELNASGLVEYAEPNYRRFPHANPPNDPRYVLGQQWALEKLAMEDAWDIQTGSDTVRIAIIDDGVDSGHEDLKDNVIAGRCFGPADFCGGVTNNGDPRSADDAHGTLVAGQAGAVGNNMTGITGTAWKVQLLPLRTDLTVDYIVEAIDYAIANGVHIINASYGGASYSQAEYDAVQRAQDAHILFVTSAGNSHTDNDKGLLSFPQAFDLDNVLTVAASDEQDRLTSWAQYGQTTVDVAAGGIGILSTNAAVAGGGPYLSASGSSFASPMIAGIAALIRSEFGDDYRGMKARIVAGADMTDPLKGRVAGGRANAFNSLQWDLDNDPVFVIDAIAVDDVVDGNGNSVLDAGETANLVVTVRSLAGAAADLGGTLVAETPGSDAVIEVTADTAGGAITDGGTAELAYQVRVPAGFFGNERVRFRLELAWDGGAAAVTRWFWHELGLIEPNTEHSFTIGRSDQDNYHAFHVDVPAGATDFRIDTSTDGGYDIDLLARHDAPPQYQINLGAGPDSSNPLFAYQPANEVRVSGEFDGNETITYATPADGTYHLVIINFGLAQRQYRLGTSWCTSAGCNCTDAGCKGRIRFAQSSFSGGASQPSVTITVVRQGGTSGAIAVGYSIDAEESTAVAGTDYTPVSGTLAWTDGDAASRSFAIPLLEGRTAGRTIRVRLENPAGTTLMSPDAVTANVQVAPPPPPRSSGGGALPAWLIAALAGFALVRRRLRPAA